MIRAIILTTVLATMAIAQDANQECFNVRDRRNPKDVYAASDDCHDYFQCFYMNETYAIGIRRRCPEGSFWHETVLSCLPEGDVPCVDRCLDDSTATRGCYAGLGCRQFYVCANTGSYGMCCPLGTQFNEASCSCDESETCGDACVQQAPIVQTTVAPAEGFNATVCRDSFGVYIAADAQFSNGYHLIDEEGQSSGLQFCVDGYAFNLQSCRCDIESGATVPPTYGLRRVKAYLPFDADTADYSIHKFATFAEAGAEQDNTQWAVGSGSLLVNGGRVEIPGLKTFDSRSAGSWCAFFRCTGPCSGAILANGKDAQLDDGFETVVLGFSGNSLIGNVFLTAPQGTQSVSTAAPQPEGWNHVCLTYDGNTVGLWLNGQPNTANVGGYLRISHAPMVVGNDQGYGAFNGNIDEVIVAPFALTQEEVEAHRDGDRAYLQGLGFW